MKEADFVGISRNCYVFRTQDGSIKKIKRNRIMIPAKSNGTIPLRVRLHQVTTMRGRGRPLEFYYLEPVENAS